MHRENPEKKKERCGEEEIYVAGSKRKLGKNGEINLVRRKLSLYIWVTLSFAQCCCFSGSGEGQYSILRGDYGLQRNADKGHSTKGL